MEMDTVPLQGCKLSFLLRRQKGLMQLSAIEEDTLTTLNRRPRN